MKPLKPIKYTITFAILVTNLPLVSPPPLLPFCNLHLANVAMSHGVVQHFRLPRLYSYSVVFDTFLKARWLKHLRDVETEVFVVSHRTCVIEEMFLPLLRLLLATKDSEIPPALYQKYKRQLLLGRDHYETYFFL